MSGEILRAVMEKSCIFSSPSFYSVELTVPATIPPILTANLTGKSDSYFLIMGVAPYLLASAGGDNTAMAEIMSFTVRSPKTSKIWTFGEMAGRSWGKNLAGMTFMSEYPLLEPDELLAVDFSTEGFAAANVAGVTFVGIEYRK